MLSIPFVLCAISPAQAVEGSQSLAVERLQRNYGLREAAVGKVWILNSERSLREAITNLGKLRTQVVGGTKALDDLVQRNAQQWEADQGLREQLRKRRAQMRSDDPERARVSKQLQRLRLRSVPPGELPSLPEAHRIAIQLTRTRDRLTLQVATLRRKVNQLLDEYAALEKNEQVQRLLAERGKSHRLGPAQNFTRLLAAVEECAQTDFVPIFQQGGHLRFSGVVNDRAPLTFTWVASGAIPIVPARLVQSARINLADGELHSRRLANGRQVQVHRTRLQSLRFGGATLRDVVVDVLSPDAEDVGALIGQAAFQGMKVTLDPPTLRLRLAPTLPQP